MSTIASLSGLSRLLSSGLAGLTLLSVGGCASYGVVDNAPLSAPIETAGYSFFDRDSQSGSRDIGLMLAFSGGGTRAAALAYGVLLELRDTEVTVNGRVRRLLDEIDIISSVSGGSFTAAYYGLFEDRLFDDYEERFLKHDVQRLLIRRLLNPLEWFHPTGRTELAVKLYEQELFGRATFADLERRGGPLILINASDLGYGTRFSFVQEYFNLLCSDIASFPVARAVTASSAFPVLFNPVVLKNYHDCKRAKPAWLLAAERRSRGNPELTEVVAGMQTYFKRNGRQYAHLVDGGITDNLGLRAIYEMIEISGGARAFVEKLGRQPPRHAAIIVVNAFADLEPTMDLTSKQPSLKDTMEAVTKAQLHRYNVATLELVNKAMTRWAGELSTPNRPVTPHFVQVSFRDHQDPAARDYFNAIPTALSLTDEQVDRVIDAGRALLRANPDYQRLLAALGGG